MRKNTQHNTIFKNHFHWLSTIKQNHMTHIPVFTENWWLFFCYNNILLWLISFFPLLLLFSLSLCWCAAVAFLLHIWTHSKNIWKWISADWKPTDLSIKYYRTLFKVFCWLLAFIYSIFMSRWYHSLSLFVRLPNHRNIQSMILKGTFGSINYYVFILLYRINVSIDTEPLKCPSLNANWGLWSIKFKWWLISSHGIER